MYRISRLTVGFVLAASGYGVYAAEQKEELSSISIPGVTSIAGYPITPYSVFNLCPSLPDSEARVVEKWLSDHYEIVDTMAAISICGKNDTLQERKKAVDGCLAEIGYANKGKHSFAVMVGNEQNLLLKWTGPWVRRGSINGLIKEKLGQKGRCWNAEVADEELVNLQNAVGQNPIATYHNVSSAAGYLLFKECERLWKKENPGKEFPLVAPTVYPIRISGKSDNPSDSNCCTVMRYMPQLQKISENPSVFLGARAVLQYVIQRGGLWDIHPGNFGITPDGKVACFDLEQPAESNPHIFPYTHNQQFHQGHSAWALDEFNKLCDTFDKNFKSEVTFKPRHTFAGVGLDYKQYLQTSNT